MQSSSIIFQGKLTKEQIVILINPVSNRLIDNQIEARIDTIWNSLLQSAKERGAKLWDSERYRLNTCKYKDNKLFLELSTIRYKVGMAMKSIPEIKGMDASYYPNALGVVSIIKTSDSKYILGKASTTFYGNVNKVKLIGGAVIKDEKEVREAKDLYDVIYQELAEETGIRKENIKNIYLTDIVRTKDLQIGMIFLILLSIGSNQAIEKFNIENDGELTDLLFVSENELPGELKKMEEYEESLAESIEHIQHLAVTLDTTQDS